MLLESNDRNNGQWIQIIVISRTSTFSHGHKGIFSSVFTPKTTSEIKSQVLSDFEATQAGTS